MLPDSKVMCPATGFAKSCRSINAEFQCPKFVHVTGANPQTGETQDKFGCVDSFLPLLMLENSQQQRQTAAAVESFRNALVLIEGDRLDRLNRVEQIVGATDMKIIKG